MPECIGYDHDDDRNEWMKMDENGNFSSPFDPIIKLIEEDIQYENFECPIKSNMLITVFNKFADIDPNQYYVHVVGQTMIFCSKVNSDNTLDTQDPVLGSMIFSIDLWTFTIIQEYFIPNNIE